MKPSSSNSSRVTSAFRSSTGEGHSDRRGLGRSSIRGQRSIPVSYIPAGKYLRSAPAPTATRSTRAYSAPEKIAGFNSVGVAGSSEVLDDVLAVIHTAPEIRMKTVSMTQMGPSAVGRNVGATALISTSTRRNTTPGSNPDDHYCSRILFHLVARLPGVGYGRHRTGNHAADQVHEDDGRLCRVSGSTLQCRLHQHRDARDHQAIASHAPDTTQSVVTSPTRAEIAPAQVTMANVRSPARGDSVRSFCNPTSRPRPSATARSLKVVLSIVAPSFGLPSTLIGRGQDSITNRVDLRSETRLHSPSYCGVEQSGSSSGS